MIRSEHGGVLIDLLVQPRASRVKIGPVHGERLKVAVTAPPVDGRANAAVLALLGKHLAVSKQRVAIASGHSGRRKTVRIRGMDEADVRAALGVET